VFLKFLMFLACWFPNETVWNAFEEFTFSRKSYQLIRFYEFIIIWMFCMALEFIIIIINFLIIIIKKKTSCHKNSVVRKKGRVLIFNRTTFAHWFFFNGKSRWEFIHLLFFFFFFFKYHQKCMKMLVLVFLLINNILKDI
jgi:hypothetical protein